jgi:glycosyltransferase involved in cell wall biosynthesis
MDLIREIDPESRGEIVYSRSLDPYANLESLLLGLAELRDYGWQATVMGDGPDRDRYEQHARDLRIDDRVDFIGAQPLERRIGIFKGAHVAVHTATYSPFPTDFLRALACGCVGIAEYQENSSAHELIVQQPRGFRTTSESELASSIQESGSIEKLEIDESYANYDLSEFLDQFIGRYRQLQSRYGLL